MGFVHTLIEEDEIYTPYFFFFKGVNNVADDRSTQAGCGFHGD